jgi:hypothetical protein
MTKRRLLRALLLASAFLALCAPPPRAETPSKPEAPKNATAAVQADPLEVEGIPQREILGHHQLHVPQRGVAPVVTLHRTMP